MIVHPFGSYARYQLRHKHFINGPKIAFMLRYDTLVTHVFKWYVVIIVWYLFIFLFSILSCISCKNSINIPVVHLLQYFLSTFFLYHLPTAGTTVWFYSRVCLYVYIFASVINYMTSNENNWISAWCSTIAYVIVSHFVALLWLI